MTTPKETTTAIMIVLLEGEEPELVLPPVELSDEDPPFDAAFDPEYWRTAKAGFISDASCACTPDCW